MVIVLYYCCCVAVVVLVIVLCCCCYVAGIVVVIVPWCCCCCCIYPAVATAAVEMLGGDELMSRSRKPEVMSDAAYEILTKTGCQQTGQFLIDDDVLRTSGVTDLDQYSNVPG